MNKDTDFKSKAPLSVEKRVEMFFIPDNVASQTDQNDENGFRNSCKRVNHCLDSFTCTLQDVAEHIYIIRELEDRERTSYHDKFKQWCIWQETTQPQKESEILIYITESPDI